MRLKTSVVGVLTLTDCDMIYGALALMMLIRALTFLWQPGWPWLVCLFVAYCQDLCGLCN